MSQGGKGETPVLRSTGGVQAEYSGVRVEYSGVQWSTSGVRGVRWSTGVPESCLFPLGMGPHFYP